MASTGKGESDREKNYRYLYGRDAEDKVKYEIPQLPLEDNIAPVRRVVCRTWNTAQTETRKIKNKTKSQLSEGLKSVGVSNYQVALQASAIVSGALVGVVVARKKSVFYRILYPVTGVGVIWSVFYLSSKPNREQVKKEVWTLWSSIRQRFK